MEKINQFSIQRFMLLMKRHTTFNLRTWLIGMGAIGGILIIIAMIQAYHSDGLFYVSGLVNTGKTAIFIAGFILTSMAYNEIHTPARSQFYLTLPATNAEKLFSHWLLTSFVYILVAFIYLSLIILIASLLSAMIWGSPLNFYNPFEGTSDLKVMGIYVVIQSSFFLGALYFRKNNFLKTVFAWFLLSMFLGLFSGLAFWIVFGTPGISFDETTDLSPAFRNFLEDTFPLIAEIVFWGLVTPFFLTVSYFKLKEREV